MTAIRVIPDIPTFNGAATGTIRFETSDGKTLHSATGNWFSDVPRSRCRKAVAGKLHPRPKQKADETPELYRERLNRWQRRFDGTAAEVERLLLDALDRRKAEAERESAQAVRCLRSWRRKCPAGRPAAPTSRRTTASAA